MRWPELKALVPKIPLLQQAEYQIGKLKDREVERLVEKLSEWYPEFVTGTESYHLEPSFFRQRCQLEECLEDRPALPVVVRHLGRIIFFVSLLKDQNALSVTGRLLVIDPEFRGQGLANLGPEILEGVARAMNAELIYYYANLSSLAQQKAAERAGFKLVGIMPASDRHIDEKKKVKRIFEAIYAKVINKSAELEIPTQLTPQSQALWNTLFGDK